MRKPKSDKKGSNQAGGSKKTPWANVAPDELNPKRQPVLIELRVKAGQADQALDAAHGLNVETLELDRSFTPVPITPHKDQAADLQSTGDEAVLIRAIIDSKKISDLESQPDVIKVWRDTPIAPFAGCPIPPCDCAPWIAKGTIADVAHYLGVDEIWNQGTKGDGIVIGIVDGGINAVGRTQKASESPQIQRVIGGWPAADWGTTSVNWSGHGNMTSTDALGMAPQAQIYDIRISDGDAISNAISGFQWAIDQHRIDGTPQILSNSWGIFQKAWDPVYATDPNHPFTRKVVEALDEGILVLFAAGNCGATCPDGRCGPDTGPGKDTWGANGHPRVMTVGAVNMNEEFIGYSSAGPAALDPNKPDFCSISHFKGFFASDSGTSAACPVARGSSRIIEAGQYRTNSGQSEGPAEIYRKRYRLSWMGSIQWGRHHSSKSCLRRARQGTGIERVRMRSKTTGNSAGMPKSRCSTVAAVQPVCSVLRREDCHRSKSDSNESKR